MKNRSFTLLLITMVIGFLYQCSSPEQAEMDALKKEVTELNELLGPPPVSLDNFYPPKADQPVYLFKMIALAELGSAIMVDMSENDLENARASLEQFKALYQEVAQMVPEWAGWYPMEPLNQFEEAFGTGDPASIMPAFDAVGATCHSCHIAFMSMVKFKYHWGDFKDFQLPDPFGEKDITVTQLMHYLSGGLTMMVKDLEQGQQEAAIRQFHGFNTSFQALKGLCGLCHETERTYYVDAKVQSMIDQLGQAVAAPEPDMAMIRNLSQGIGMESCFKCHLVHTPASLAKDAWRHIE